MQNEAEEQTNIISESVDDSTQQPKGSAFWHAYNDAMPALEAGLGIGLAIEIAPVFLIAAKNAMKLPMPWLDNIQKINPLAAHTFSTTTILVTVCTAAVFIPNYLKYKAEEEAATNTKESSDEKSATSFVQREQDKKKEQGFVAHRS
ncbi:MAG: hypothetical protein EAZ74_03980 [Alphaproteobacteria bacterium]|nr:MAG: hypothetical protein EAY76_03975 [Alphaproteobacteria bacterium]TAF14396.1 MAG: hypothetical protein EAZ74_03980 [Alphaproteobacteria bacterium]TAF40108.1 MAG: hypothetical protein EAZ66_03705 [Alphaproteobacteria bacterium]TAF77540.1 MAG: hypothetical protein EAZ52_00110 [Alphaproteobacteria bacterium]